MKKGIFTPPDIRQMMASAIAPDSVEQQLACFRQGPACLQLHRPCAVDDGIVSLSPKQRKRITELYKSEAGRYKTIKFVPASGAASRMFTEWFPASERGSFGSVGLDRKFWRDLQRFPFFPLIAEDGLGAELLRKKDIKGLLEFVLGKEGLNYGNLPKALIPFHRYPEGTLRNPLEEHLQEATGYIARNKNIVHLHFTLSVQQRQAVAKYLKKIKTIYEGICRIKYDIKLSVQAISTNTVAVDENNLPLRNARGQMVFRPGGHGALLANLNSLDADLIFIRNIDNIAPRNCLEKHLPFREVLGGMALEIQKENFALLRALEEGQTDLSEVNRIVDYCSQTLNIVFPRGFTGQTRRKKVRTLFSLLNRPLRICGMVKNNGEPGGGPFWVEEKDGTQTLQIVESGHTDKSNPDQLTIWSRAQYFNPVDMVCCIKNYNGGKFNLDEFVNKDAYLITTKNERGIKFKALEMPGLWNGGMAYWNTVFVELPLMVFNPVKTVYDLLRREHRALS